MTRIIGRISIVSAQMQICVATEKELAFYRRALKKGAFHPDGNVRMGFSPNMAIRGEGNLVVGCQTRGLSGDDIQFPTRLLGKLNSHIFLYEEDGVGEWVTARLEEDYFVIESIDYEE